MHRRQISAQPFTDTDLVTTQDVGLPFAALFFKVIVERIPVGKARYRHHKVASSVPDKAFDLTLIIALSRATVTVPDHIMREHRAETLRVPSGMILATKHLSLS